MLFTVNERVISYCNQLLFNLHGWATASVTGKISRSEEGADLSSYKCNSGALYSIREFNTVSLAESNIPHQIDFLNIFTEQISFFCHNVHGCATASVIGKRSGTEEGAWQI